MAYLWALIVRNPIGFCRFLYAFGTHVILLSLRQALLPGWPAYQSFRTQLQRAYWASSLLVFPELIRGPPVTDLDCPPARARRVGVDWTGYVIPGSRDLKYKQPNNGLQCVVLFAHGGGYARGEARMYLDYMKRWIEGALEEGLNLTFLSVEYPLSDEAPCPAQQEAFLKAYKYVLDEGVAPKDIIFMGDSAGGGLCVLSLLEAKNRGLPQPAGGVLLSPWMDVSLRSFQGGNALVETDFLVNANEVVPMMASAWLKGKPATSPAVNPLFCTPVDFQGLCPLLIFVGGGECMLQDSKDLASLCRAGGVPHHLEVEWGQLHVYGLGHKWVSPAVRQKTDRMIYRWVKDCAAGRMCRDA
ncbi:hypothetical protein NW759_015000 [Fusarium solani]|nr:hypothetical protein NW759_015000 [Fusarium solani]